ncbi:MAG: type II toxin-antitoxin system RelE/ParE family toxin [Planctomycetes bacterium]|nr:type II toxin-antitoxin system RelE/ParE family toxin [Planctomycetota bacterium]
MSRYRLSAQARSDLDDIWLYIASDNVTAADGFIDVLVGKFQTLATQPGVGRTRDELGESVRSFPVGNYVIFYRAMRDGIEVARVLSGFRDIPNVFAGD